MELYEAMRTTFAARIFEPGAIPDDVLYRILDNARFAPSGGNRQGWRVISVRDGNKRDRLVDLMQPAARRYFAHRYGQAQQPGQREVPGRHRCERRSPAADGC